MKYNDKEVIEVFEFDGKPKDMLVWNDEEPVIRQVVAKIDSDTPWIAALKGDHHEGGDEAAFGAWKHAAELNEPLMTNKQFAEYIKTHNVGIKVGNDLVTTYFPFPIKDADLPLNANLIIYDLDSMQAIVPTKDMYNKWKNYITSKYVPCKFNVSSMEELL